jgi:hypothetical protein
MIAVSIECAPPYEEGNRHEIFAQALRGLLHQVSESGEEASIVQLVDDETYQDNTFDFDGYADWLRSNGFKPDLVARESQIVDACDDVLGVIDYTKLRPKLGSILRSRDKYISQLFIAAWCLIRLGYLQNDQFDPSFQAEKLINILPTAFKPGEDDSLAIIRATLYADAADKIEYIFLGE